VPLLKILDRMNAPDYAYVSILKWARDASADGYDFRPRGGFDRSKSVDYLTNSVLNGKLLLPYVRNVDLPHGLFCFLPQSSLTEGHRRGMRVLHMSWVLRSAYHSPS
jgi:hypothetical protein